MTAYDVARWNRCMDIASDYGVKIQVKSDFILTDSKGLVLGSMETVEEILAFLFGYASGCKRSKKGGA